MFVLFLILSRNVANATPTTQTDTRPLATGHEQLRDYPVARDNRAHLH
jgi:hypothetical protein